MTSLMVETIRCQACNAGITEENVRLNRCGCSICVECSRKPPAGGSTCPQCADECNELEQIKPCGCFLCKKCLINWLTATRMETDWICWSCGAAVETHTAAPQAMVAAAAAAAATASTDGKKKAAPRKKAGTPTKKRKRIPTSQKDIVDSLLSPTTNNNNNNNMTSPKDDSKTRKKRLTFQQRFEALLRYKERHGNINVPWRYDEDGNLGEWVKNVRRGVKKLTMDERRMLNSLGFSWETKRNKFDREWKERLERLKSYKRRFGDCYVPWQWEEDKQLAEVSLYHDECFASF